ncbi:guanylate kinase [Mycoplasmopsis lipofaciens]|uniref:guanylate kinase n=1 Tax=Mycoplasmopsis lipofaciens TaxID=114884 RepID=UPI000488CBCC|nr:guanylate kinase [Mycoplasmopsis lipofaciens]
MINIKRKKPLIIFTGPSGVGKGTIEPFLFKSEKLKLQLSCSTTTRKPREGEINGIHYFYITKEKFEDHIKNNELIEYSFHFDNYYGTLYTELDRILKLNKIPFLEIETNGAKQILEKMKNSEEYQVLTFFILPPDLNELKRRILNRNTETQDAIQKRLKKAEEEIEDRHIFKYNILNDVPERAASEIESIIIKEFNL